MPFDKPDATTTGAETENLNTLWEYCCSENRAIPRDWNGVYQMLKGKRQKPSGGWEPSLPLILTAWDTTSAIDKQLRFREHLEWAKDQGQIAEIDRYLRSLRENDWYHFSEL